MIKKNNRKRGSFRNLKIWKKGPELLMEIYEISRRFPQEERYNLTSQLRSSAGSVIALIAEAHGRYYYADKRRVLFQSRGECEETQSHLSVALGLGYISNADFKRLDMEYEGLGVGINYYVTSLVKKLNH